MNSYCKQRFVKFQEIILMRNIFLKKHLNMVVNIQVKTLFAMDIHLDIRLMYILHPADTDIVQQGHITNYGSKVNFRCTCYEYPYVYMFSKLYLLGK